MEGQGLRRKDLGVVLDMAVDAVDFYRALMVMRCDVDEVVVLLRERGEGELADRLVGRADALLSDRSGMRGRFEELAVRGVVGVPVEALEAEAVVRRLRLRGRGG